MQPDRALTDRFTRAVDYARIAHAGQTRKGTDIPHLTHLLGVAALVIEYGGTEDQAIAGLLHDTIEDCGQAHAAIIRATFGDRVADIVEACTDGTAEGKGGHDDAEARGQDWLRRKRKYLAHLEHADDATLLVSACDKLHNALAIVADLENPDVGVRVFERFTGGARGTLWNYESPSEIFVKRETSPAVFLRRKVERMCALATEVT